MSTSGPPDGSETAQVIQDLLRTCTHDRATQGEADALAAAEILVQNASRCLEAAQSMIDARAHSDLVEDYLAQSEAAAENADRLLDRALAEERLAEGAEAAASDAASVAGASTSLGPIGLAERARDQAGEAQGLVEGDVSRRARILRAHCADIRNRVRLLLAGLQ